MKTHELAKLLLEHPDQTIILQKDAEGNGYSPLSGIDFSVVYVPENTWSGEVYTTEHSAEDHCMDEDKWEFLKENNANFAVMYPVN